MKRLLSAVISVAVMLGAAPAMAQEVRVDVGGHRDAVDVRVGNTVDVQVGNMVNVRVPLLPCGLFGRPSKRELMGQMIAQQQEHAAIHREHVMIHREHLAESRETNATLHRLEVAQARQEEVLRQIAGQTARAADNTQRAADTSQRAAEAMYKMSDHMASPKLRDVAPGTNRAPPDLGALPDVPPTASPNLRTVQPGIDRAPDMNATPDINVGPILQGTRGKTYYAKKQPPAPPKKASAPQYTNYSLRN